ncbi:hypothetical protein [Tropicibacter sp. S64]|uniref:hypothetical protein n=1 Tax=Tropicibacter sp. S64 TaxID=3415122 RepID=UPI003C7C6BAB
MRFTSLALAFVCLAVPAHADNVITSNTIIRNNLCVGDGCVDPEPYATGEALVRLRDIYPRIEFFDTSTDAGSYSYYDWRIRANEDFFGGLNLFAVDNLSTGARPFTILGDAPSNSLYVHNSGKIGLRTTLPQQDIHIVSPSTPGIRFEQSTAGGFPAQTYEMIFNSAGMAIRDVNLNTAPLSIAKNAPEYSLRISQEGNIGIGTGSVGAALHILRDNGNARIRIEEDSPTTAAREMLEMRNNGGSYFTLANTATGNSWYYVHENNPQGRFFINHSDGGLQLALTRTGDMTLMGDLYTAGSCSAGCDRVFDEDYPLPTIAEQAALMKSLKHLPNVGPTPEDGPFNLTKMTGGMLNELEKAHLYIAELEARMADLEAERAEIAELRRMVEALAAR